MTITAIINTHSNKTEVVKNPDGIYKIYISTPPIEGKANKKIIELLASFFDIPKSNIKIIRGLKSKVKTIELIKN